MDENLVIRSGHTLTLLPVNCSVSRPGVANGQLRNDWQICPIVTCARQRTLGEMGSGTDVRNKRTDVEKLRILKSDQFDMPHIHLKTLSELTWAACGMGVTSMGPSKE